MNGGTNIAAAIHRAGQLFKNSPESTTRVLCLMTDGRVDRYQSREAANMLAAMAGEQRGVVLYTFGVGRGVDDGELHFLASMTDGRAGSPSVDAEGGSPTKVGTPTSMTSCMSSGTRVEAWEGSPLQRCFMLRVMDDLW